MGVLGPVRHNYRLCRIRRAFGINFRWARGVVLGGRRLSERVLMRISYSIDSTAHEKSARKENGNKVIPPGGFFL
jgi:hypothetical protein